MKRILYVDIPFMGINDGGANRSKFLWQTLISQYEVDWVEIRRAGISAGKGLPSGLGNHYVLNAEIDKRPLNPVNILRFRHESEEKFLKIVSSGDYYAVIFRFLSPARLADIAEKHCHLIIFDVDMLLSRITKLSWEKRPVFSNRYYLIEKLKLEAFEKKFFRKPYMFLFTNSSEQKWLQQYYKVEGANNIKVLPNVMKEEQERDAEEEQRILFFGTLSSSANTDALEYISHDLYPLLENELEKRDIYLDAAGRGYKDSFTSLFAEKKRFRYVGEVDDIQKEIKKSMLIFLPLRIASGTRTRILEAANQAKAVVTTPIGVEGLEFGNNEIVSESDKEMLVKSVIQLLDNEIRRKNLGQKLLLKSREMYLDKNVSAQFINYIENGLK